MQQTWVALSAVRLIDATLINPQDKRGLHDKGKLSLTSARRPAAVGQKGRDTQQRLR